MASETRADDTERAVASGVGEGHCPDAACGLADAGGRYRTPSDGLPVAEDTSNVTRVEIIDGQGRAFTGWGYSNVRVSLQDDGRTLKVFCDGAPARG